MKKTVKCAKCSSRIDRSTSWYCEIDPPGVYGYLCRNCKVTGNYRVVGTKLVIKT